MSCHSSKLNTTFTFFRIVQRIECLDLTNDLFDLMLSLYCFGCKTKVTSESVKKCSISIKFQVKTTTGDAAR